VHLNTPTQLLIIFVVFQGLQWLKDNIVAPRYIGNVIGLHPVTIFIAIMIGAKLDGMLGIIFALPVACVINVVINHLPSHTVATPSASEEAINVNPDSTAGEPIAKAGTISPSSDEQVAEPST